MKCWHCMSELIWQNDFSYEDYCIEEVDGIISELVCSNEECATCVRVYKDL